MEGLFYTQPTVMVASPSTDQPQMPYGNLMIGMFAVAILISLFSRL